jgi:hypothetical protein
MFQSILIILRDIYAQSLMYLIKMCVSYDKIVCKKYNVNISRFVGCTMCIVY